MKNWKRVLVLVTAIGLATGLTACGTTQGNRGTPADGYTQGTPDTLTTAYPKDPVGLLSGSYRQTITMPMKQQCAHYAACTQEEQERIVNGCEVARDAWGPNIHDYAGNGVVGAVPGVAGLALGGFAAGFNGQTILTNTLFNTPYLVAEHAYQGDQYGVIDSFAFDQKCQSAMLQASGIAFLESRPVSKGSPKVVALLPNGQVMPRGYTFRDEAPIFDTSQLSPENAAIVNGCQKGLDRNDMFLVDKFNACLAKAGKPPLPPNLFHLNPVAAAKASPPPPPSPAPKGKGKPAPQRNERWTDK
jgi:hypothetical protein